jgi:hypothetical protein
VQRQPYSSYPQYIVLNGMSRYDDIDRLAADVAAAIRSRGDEFEDERQLCSWLEEDQVQYDERSLIAAIRQLENLGRISITAAQGTGNPTVALVLIGVANAIRSCVNKLDQPTDSNGAALRSVQKAGGGQPL